jgi:carbon monoxide dehydrogenase subunit G
MELINEFRVGVPIQQAWAVLTDVERIAPCLPGAQLQEVEGDEYRGVVKVKVGPITAQYKGKASFIEQDTEGWKAVLKAEGRDTRGQGNASALVTATLVPEGDATTVKVVTDLTITGKVAQFGRGVLADVSSKLIEQFVTSLEQDVLAGSPPTPPQPSPPASGAGSGPAAGAGSGAAAAPASAPAGGNGAQATVRRIDHPDATPVDLIETAGAPLAKRIVPLVLAVLAFFLLRRRRQRRSRSDG